MSKKHSGRRHIIVRADDSIHDKIRRIMNTTGADKSTVVRAVLGFLTEDQLIHITNIQKSAKTHRTAKFDSMV